MHGNKFCIFKTSSYFYFTASGEEEVESWAGTFTLLGDILKLPATPITIVELCDKIDTSKRNSREKFLLSLRRQALLSTMLSNDRNQYLETVKFLGPRIPRKDLPNLQDIPYFDYDSIIYSDNSVADTNEKNMDIITNTADQTTDISVLGTNLIQDCALPNITYVESPLDVLLLGIFRGFVQKEVSFKSETAGIRGLLEEGKHYYLSELGSVTENQHAFVRRTLGSLLTPFLPPFYRIFMSGIIPSTERGEPKWLADGTIYILDQIKNISIIGENKWVQENLVPGSQLGPLFYAPFLTSVVTPPFLNFLVGTYLSFTLSLSHFYFCFFLFTYLLSYTSTVFFFSIDLSFLLYFSMSHPHPPTLHLFLFTLLFYLLDFPHLSFTHLYP